MQHAAGDASLETVYDLASLTKPMAVGSLLMRAWHQGRVTLDETALGVATVGDLAGHVSGLPAHRHYYESCDSPAAIRRAVLSEPLVAARGTAIYSDLGYMVLGWFLEERLGASLQDLFAGVAAELELSSTQYLPGSSEPVLPKEMIAPTEVIDGQALCGTVHDGNARALGGVAGHAGLFGTAHDVHRWGSEVLSAWCGESDTFSQAVLRRLLAPQPNTTWRKAFDSVSARGSSAGRFFGPEAFGHLGFTGTSIWIDPACGWVVTLLSNRVHPVVVDNPAIKRLRPVFHDAFAARVNRVMPAG